METNPKETISIRINKKDRRDLDAFGKLTTRKRSELIEEAIRTYLDVQRWQLTEIEEAVREADAGDFATENDVKRTFAKLTK